MTTVHNYSTLLSRLLCAVDGLSPSKAAIVGIWWGRWSERVEFGDKKDDSLPKMRIKPCQRCLSAVRS